MIVYSAGRKWFEKKDEALAHRRTLPRTAPLNAIVVEGRSDLCALLNALCGAPAGQDEAVFIPAGSPVTQMVLPAYVGAPIIVPDCVPAFLLKDRRAT